MLIFLRIWIILFFVSSVSFAMPQLNENILLYKINGKTGHELQKQMNTLGPKNQSHQFNASTQWFVTWNYSYELKNNLCQLTSLQVNLDIFYLYPTWINYQTAHSSLKKKWDICFQNLRMHEEGHGTNGKIAAQTVEKALLKISPKETCDQLQIIIDQTAHQIINNHLAKDAEYDVISQHGRV